MRRTALLLGLFVCACRTAQSPESLNDTTLGTAHIVEAVPTFDGEGKGTLELAVDVKPLGSDVQAESLDWELWLGTRHFASGVQQVGQPLSSKDETRIHVSMPLVFRGVQGSAEPQVTTVSVRGGVRVKFPGTYARYPFEASYKEKIANAPLPSGVDEE